MGACTGLGADASSTMACLLAGVSAHADLAFGNRTTCGAALAHDGKPGGTERMLTLARAALGEASEVDLAWPLPVLFCCPGPDEVPCPPEQLLARLCAEEPSLVAAQGGRVFPGGRRDLPALLAAIEKTRASARAPACVLLGADSLLDPSRLAIVDHRRGLRSMEDPGGVFPGEAAVALVLGPRERGRKQTEVAAFAAGQALAGSLPGAVLGTLVERALQEAGIEPRQVACVAHDLGGPAGMEELHSMLSRVPLAGVTHTLAPGDTLGETGAASALLTLAVAVFFRDKGVYQGAALCIASDETGFRGVTVVR